MEKIMQEKQKLMQKLVDELLKANYNYYVLDNPTISDKEWDKMYDELVKLEKETTFNCHVLLKLRKGITERF